MNKPFRWAILGLGAAIASHSSLGSCALQGKIDGWESAKFGMTQNQIALAFPDAKEDASTCDAPLPDWEGDCHFLLLKKYQTLGDEWVVMFAFSKEKRLESIRLGGMSGDALAARKRYDDLKVVLTEKYGKGIEKHVDDDHDCENVYQRYLRREKVRFYEFYASHKETRYTVEGVNGKVRLSLNLDSVCKQAPKEVSRGQPSVDIEYREAGTNFGNP